MELLCPRGAALLLAGLPVPILPGGQEAPGSEAATLLVTINGRDPIEADSLRLHLGTLGREVCGHGDGSLHPSVPRVEPWHVCTFTAHSQ